MNPWPFRVTMFFCVLAALLLVWWLPAPASPVLSFQACYTATCAAPTAEQAQNIGIEGLGQSFTVATDTVTIVGAVAKCPNCAVLRNKEGRTLHVLGAPGDVACKVFGGMFCAEGKR